MRVGIVGFGMRATLVDEVRASKVPAEVSVICDPAPRAVADAAERCPGVPVVATVEEMLAAGVDAALVLTPDDQHTQPVLACLHAGVPVFCEKPLATTVEDADLILTTAFKTNTRLYVGHNMRHMPVIRLMKELIDAGRIGEVKAIWCRHFVGNGGDYYFKDWHADRSRTGSLLLQKGAHDIDVIHWLAGSFTRKVQAVGDLAIYGLISDRRDRAGERMRDWISTDNWPPTNQQGLNPVVDVEDISMLNMVLDSGVLASYQQCHFTPDYWRNYTVICTAGRIENVGDEQGAKVLLWDRRHLGYAPADEEFLVPEATGGPEDATQCQHGGADQYLIDEFLRFAAEGGMTETSPVAAREAVVTGLVATASLRGAGGLMPVPELAPEIVEYFAGGQPRLPHVDAVPHSGSPEAPRARATIAP